MAPGVIHRMIADAHSQGRHRTSAVVEVRGIQDLFQLTFFSDLIAAQCTDDNPHSPIVSHWGISTESTRPGLKVRKVRAGDRSLCLLSRQALG